MPAATASVKLLDPVLQIARHSQLDLQGLLQAARLEGTDRDLPGARFPASAFSRLLEELARRTGNDRIALRIGEATQPRMLGSVGFLMTTAPDLRSACQVLIDYLPLLSEGMHLQMDQGPEHTELTLELENPGERRTAEWFLAWLLNWPRWLSGKQIPALKVRFVCPAPDEPAAWERFFAAEVSFAADCNQLLIPNSYLQLPCQDASEEMHRLHREFADNLLSESSREGALIARVKSQIRKQLSDGRGSIHREQIAATLNLSLRTLQRKLTALGSSYQDLYDQTRKELALQQIQSGGVSFGELSFMLGFSGQSAFQKAFRRWMGMPPSHYRDSLRPPLPPGEQPQRPGCLADLIPDDGMEPDLFIELALQLSAALERLHQQGDRSPDLSPDHISVDTTGGEPQVSLIDPQPLRPMDPLQRLARLAPENCSPDAAGSDYRADLYSLGCIFTEMLTGRPLWQTRDAGELLRAHLSAPLPDFHTLPEALALLLRSLLARLPEQRLQNCHQLTAELLRCRQQLTGTDKTPTLPPAADRIVPLQLSPRLYGRQQPLHHLLQQLQGCHSGNSSLTLVRGETGIGKTALIDLLQQQLAGSGLSFIRGSFESPQLQQPWSGFIQAVRQAIRQRLSAPREQFRQWSRMLSARAGRELALLRPLIPEIEFVVGSPTPSEPPGAAELEQRIRQAFVSILSGDHKTPTVLCFDNLQWIDEASAGLLRTLVRQPGCSLAVIASLRTDDPAQSPALNSLLAGLEQANNYRSIELQPLSAGQTRQLVSDSFHDQGPEPVALAGWLHSRSQGNPLALRRSLIRLHQEGWICYDPQRQCWRWQKELSEAEQLTGDIRQLLEHQMATLPEITRRMLRQAAALGSSFDLEMLSKISNEPQARLAIHLWPALQQSLISSESRQPGRPESYRFTHEHIRLTAYRCNTPEQRRQLHLRIGQVLLRSYSRQPQPGAAWNPVNHLNRASQLLTREPERLQLIRLNLSAADDARTTSAFRPARRYLRKASRLLTPQDWQHQYPLCSSVMLALAHCEFLCSNHSRAAELCQQMSDRFHPPQDQARLSRLQAELLLARDRCDQASTLLIRSLSRLQQPISEDPAELRQQLQQLAERAGLSDIDQLAEPQPEADENMRIVLELLWLLYQAGSRSGDQQRAAAALTRMTELSLEQGRSPQLPLALAGYACLTSWTLGDGPSAASLANRSLKLADAADNRTIQAETRLLIATRLLHWSEHLKRSLPLLDESRELALQSGDWSAAGQAILMEGFNRWLSGEPLSELQPHLRNRSQLLAQIGRPQQQSLLEQALIRPLQRLIAGDDSDTARGADLNLSGPKELKAWSLPAVLTRAYLLDQRDCWPSLLEHETLLEQQLAGSYAHTEALFMIALMRLEHCREADQQQRNRLLTAVTYSETRLELWGRHCPPNFSHRQALIGALKAELRDLPEHATTLFEQAIEGAEAGGFIHHQALASELYGRFWQRRERRRLARYLTEDARALYRRWGAMEKAAKLS